MKKQDEAPEKMSIPEANSKCRVGCVWHRVSKNKDLTIVKVNEHDGFYNKVVVFDDNTWAYACELRVVDPQKWKYVEKHVKFVDPRLRPGNVWRFVDRVRCVDAVCTIKSIEDFEGDIKRVNFVDGDYEMSDILLAGKSNSCYEYVHVSGPTVDKKKELVPVPLPCECENVQLREKIKLLSEENKDLRERLEHAQCAAKSIVSHCEVTASIARESIK